MGHHLLAAAQVLQRAYARIPEEEKS